MIGKTFRLVLGAAAFALMPTGASGEPADRSRFEDRPAEVSRHFADIGGSQIHFRRAGEEADKPPLVLFHQSPNSSQVFVEFMAEIGADRLVYAPDTPGFGESDLPPEAPEIADYADAMVRFLDSQSLSKVDLLGYHTGAAIAIEIARRHPGRVNRLVLVGIPAFTPEESAAFEAQPWPQPFDAQGDAVAASWRSSQQWAGAGQDDASVRRWFDQKIANGSTAWWGARAALRYRTIEALREVAAPILFVRPRDDLWESSLRVQTAIPDTERLDLPQYGFGLFEAAPEELALRIRAHLDQ
ncbi:alpha/beta fold hydrolase [Altererythrobacter sp. MF3-039]|uniref:alpha/beta fold hydrolase n=1 Tax=Altererythrobacter sp. MF3-039 TaxID=3252901 RepID=UPI00390C8398